MYVDGDSHNVISCLNSSGERRSPMEMIVEWTRRLLSGFWHGRPIGCQEYRMQWLINWRNMLVVFDVLFIACSVPSNFFFPTLMVDVESLQ